MKVGRIFVILFCVFLGSIPALAQANTLQDLVGGNAASGESQLESRGYTYEDGTKDDEGSWTYWWNSNNKKCVYALTEDGRYRKIGNATPSDCKQKKGMSNGDKVALAVIGGAAAIGVAAAVHKAHHHDDDNHYDNDRDESEYERGHRDGLHNNSYHNWSDTKQYKDGYKSGVNQRRWETPYSSGYGGYAPYTSTVDLYGARAAGGESELISRGFRIVNTTKFGDQTWVIWYNPGSNQCVRAVVKDGKFDSLLPVTSPYCR